jgi:hypothetical protein
MVTRVIVKNLWITALEAAAREKICCRNLAMRPTSISAGNSYNNLGLGLIPQGEYSTERPI